MLREQKLLFGPFDILKPKVYGGHFPFTASYEAIRDTIQQIDVVKRLVKAYPNDLALAAAHLFALLGLLPGTSADVEVILRDPRWSLFCVFPK